MAVILEQIYEKAINEYHMKLVAGETGLWKLVDWVHVLEEIDYVEFLKGRELIVLTGIKNSTEEELLNYTRKVYEAKASGLVINVGKYIPKIPKVVLEFGKQHDFAIFSLPWEVHLVDFNRELCNLIYKAAQEHQTLDCAIQKAIFEPKDMEQYLSVLQKEDILPNTDLCMIQCYFPFEDLKKKNLKKNPEEKEKESPFDVTRFYHFFQQHCQQVLSRQKYKYVVFHYDLYITIVLAKAERSGVEKLMEELYQYTPLESGICHAYTAVSDFSIHLESLAKTFQNLMLLCKWNAKEEKNIRYDDEIGVWKLLLDLSESSQRAYKERYLGVLEQVDRDTGSEYCKILRTYIEENGNVQEIAAKCFLHRNTVSYHLKKIMEITGWDLNRADTRSELYLAFQVKRILEL